MVRWKAEDFTAANNVLEFQFLLAGMFLFIVDNQMYQKRLFVNQIDYNVHSF
jgi:hypothetical protein